MSKINGDKARQNLHDWKRARMRERVRRLLKPGPAGPRAPQPQQEDNLAGLGFVFDDSRFFVRTRARNPREIHLSAVISFRRTRPDSRTKISCAASPWRRDSCRTSLSYIPHLFRIVG